MLVWSIWELWRREGGWGWEFRSILRGEHKGNIERQMSLIHGVLGFELIILCYICSLSGLFYLGLRFLIIWD